MECRSCGHRNDERSDRCARCGALLGATIESISAVTLLTSDMTRAVRFYRSLGFELRYGGESDTFTSFRLEQGHLNLMARPGLEPPPFWGRVILYVSDVDALYHRALVAGQRPEAPPRDAEWGERYFHLADPDGHQLSFARPLSM